MVVPSNMSPSEINFGFCGLSTKCTIDSVPPILTHPPSPPVNFAHLEPPSLTTFLGLFPKWERPEKKTKEGKVRTLKKFKFVTVKENHPSPSKQWRPQSAPCWQTMLFFFLAWPFDPQGRQRMALDGSERPTMSLVPLVDSSEPRFPEPTEMPEVRINIQKPSCKGKPNLVPQMAWYHWIPRSTNSALHSALQNRVSDVILQDDTTHTKKDPKASNSFIPLSTGIPPSIPHSAKVESTGTKQQARGQVQGGPGCK